MIFPLFKVRPQDIPHLDQCRSSSEDVYPSHFLCIRITQKALQGEQFDTRPLIDAIEQSIAPFQSMPDWMMRHNDLYNLIEFRGNLNKFDYANKLRDVWIDQLIQYSHSQH